MTLPQPDTIHSPHFNLLQEANMETMPPRVLQSTALNEIFTALAKAQGEMESASLTSINPFFKSKYAALPEIIKSSRPALVKHGLSVIQRMATNDKGELELHSILGHTSGQWISSVMRINPQKPDVQSLGSYITYLKRYMYVALVGVIVADDLDDDGESAVTRNKKPGIPTWQQRELLVHLDNNKDLLNKIMKEFGSLDNIPQDRFQKVLEYTKSEALKKA